MAETQGGDFFGRQTGDVRTFHETVLWGVVSKLCSEAFTLNRAKEAAGMDLGPIVQVRQDGRKRGLYVATVGSPASRTLSFQPKCPLSPLQRGVGSGVKKWPCKHGSQFGVPDPGKHPRLSWKVLATTGGGWAR